MSIVILLKHNKYNCACFSGKTVDNAENMCYYIYNERNKSNKLQSFQESAYNKNFFSKFHKRIARVSLTMLFS